VRQGKLRAMSRGRLIPFPRPRAHVEPPRVPAWIVDDLRRLATGEDDLRLARAALDWIATWAPAGTRPLDVLGRMLAELRRAR
jgi:hypothetical protein